MFNLVVTKIGKHFYLWGSQWLRSCELGLPYVLYASMYISIWTVTTHVDAAMTNIEKFWEILIMQICMEKTNTGKFKISCPPFSAKIIQINRSWITDTQLWASTYSSFPSLRRYFTQIRINTPNAKRHPRLSTHSFYCNPFRINRLPVLGNMLILIPKKRTAGIRCHQCGSC